MVSFFSMSDRKHTQKRKKQSYDTLDLFHISNPSNHPKENEATEIKEQIMIHKRKSLSPKITIKSSSTLGDSRTQKRNKERDPPKDQTGRRSPAGRTTLEKRQPGPTQRPGATSPSQSRPKLQTTTQRVPDSISNYLECPPSQQWLISHSPLSHPPPPNPRFVLPKLSQSSLFLQSTEKDLNGAEAPTRGHVQILIKFPKIDHPMATLRIPFSFKTPLLILYLYSK